MALVATAPVPAGFSRRQVLKVVGATAAVAGAICIAAPRACPVAAGRAKASASTTDVRARIERMV